MTKIIVDKQTAIRAVYHLFNIPCCGTNPEITQQYSNWPIEVVFDFDKDNLIYKIPDGGDKT